MKNQKITATIFTKKILLAFLTIALLFTFVNPLSVIEVKANGDLNWTDSGNYDTSWYGDGSASEYFINSPEKLAGLAVLNNGLNGVTAVDFTDKTIMLGSNIDLTGKDWTAIGTYIDVTTNIPFIGTFDGDGHTISGIYINKTGTEMTDCYQGLFGYSKGTIKNVGVINSTIYGYYSIGGVVGYCNSGIVQNCYNTGSVSTYNLSAGGVVGQVSKGTIDNCYNAGTVSGAQQIGGVVGTTSVSSKIQNSYNTGTVNSSKFVGGVVGALNSSTTTNCYNTGTITGVATAIVTSGMQTIGGVVGYSDNGAIINSYNTGEISGPDSVGGVAGYQNSTATTRNCYNIGTVTGTTNIGGVIGHRYLGVISSSYSLDTSCTNAGYGTVKTSDEMQSQDFVALLNANVLTDCKYWQILTGTNNNYPIFSENAIPTISNISAPSAIVSGNSLTLSIPTVWENNSAIIAQGWEISEDGSSAWTTYTTGTLDISYNNYYLRYYATNGVGTTYSNIVTITVNPVALVNAHAPIFTTNLSGNATYTKDDTASALSVTATVSDGGKVTYQWYKNTTNSTTGATEISGATSATYTPLTDTVGTTYYYVVATNTNSSVNGNKTTTTTSGVKTVVINASTIYNPDPTPSTPSEPIVTPEPKTVKVIETPVGMKNSEKITVKPVGEAFDKSVEVRMKDDATVKVSIEKALNDTQKEDLKNATIFPLDISLYEEGTDTKVQPNERTSVTITCPIPEILLADKDYVKVVCIIDNKLTVLETKIILVDEVYCVEFKATHFSPYAMVVDTTNALNNVGSTTNDTTSDNKNPITGQSNLVATLSIIAILSVLTLAVVNKKRNLEL